VRADDTTPFGPCIVAAHAFPDPQNVPLHSTLNGTVMQNGHTKRALFARLSAFSLIGSRRDQLFTLAQAISYMSQGSTLLPGSLVFTGTPPGVGYVRSPPVVLKHGDDVRVSIEGGIGTLVNKVIEEGRE
jgi:2-keto-4-pentenoate hydratase/2-oxohepta-3-ene-1,7-dioic acid hydratase in catechol pathway